VTGQLASTAAMHEEQDRRIAAALEREHPRLRNWLRRRVAEGDVDDVLQDVFSELVIAYRLGQQLQDVGAWLFRVARNRATDLFRKRRPEALDERLPGDDDEPSLADLLPSPEAGPEEEYLHGVLIDELAVALATLPPEQRAVFLAHEVEGLSFREISSRTGVGVNTLLSRKHYAVLQLRRRLQAIHEELLTD
jgi:RNA polymerase sigma factor (sigma-70 family)